MRLAPRGTRDGVFIHTNPGRFGQHSIGVVRLGQHLVVSLTLAFPTANFSSTVSCISAFSMLQPCPFVLSRILL